MHEMSLAESVVQLVEAAAAGERAQRVSCVWVEIGQLSCVAPAALRFCFDAVARGGIAAGARLEIVEIAGAGRCEACAADFALSELPAMCPVCGSARVQPQRGTEMRVREIAVE